MSSATDHPSTTSAYHEQMKTLLHQLPSHNYLTLKYLISLLVVVTKNEAVNKMNPPAVGIVFGPNILRWLLELQSVFIAIFQWFQHLFCSSVVG